MGNNAQRGRVLVLKERSASDDTAAGARRTGSSSGRDAYEVALNDAGFQVDFLPVLQHRLVNTDKIAKIVVNAAQAYSGIIFTSQRAVEAWSAAGQASLSTKSSHFIESRATMPFYAVGPATEAALLKLPLDIRPLDSSILGAEESGSAEKLADFIVSYVDQDDAEHQQAPSRRSQRPLLYLVGDKRRETLPALLKAKGIPLVELQAYETFPSASFVSDFNALVERQAPNTYDWIVFFSPSGAKLLLPLLPGKDSSSDSGQAQASHRFAAIGPTTRDFLLDHAGIQVDAMASSPNSTALVAAMLAADSTA